MPSSRKRIGLGLVAFAVASSGVSVLAAAPASANTTGTGLVINEVYGGGGNAGSTYTNDFIELYNPTGAAVSVAGWSVQYRSTTGTSAQLTALTGTVPAGGYYLVQEAAGSGGTTALPTPDATGSIAMSGTGAVVILADNTDPVTATGDFAVTKPAHVIDTIGWNTTATTYETAPAPATANATSDARKTAGTDSDANASDFAAGTPTPTNSAGVGAPLTAKNPGDRTLSVNETTVPFTLAVTGGTAPYSWTSTALPAGLTLSQSGTISGTPTATGTTSVNATVTDSKGATSPTTFSITVSPAATPTPIAVVQGTGTGTSPVAGQTVTVEGRVTAAYPTGGFTGFYLQTGGSGGATDATPNASDAIFVYSPGLTTYPSIGDSMRVTGRVSEFSGTTEITASSATALTSALPPVTALVGAYPTTEATREAHEGELLAPTNTFTVTDNYSTNQYGEIGLATGDKPLITPTEVADAQDSAAIAAVVADNAARGVVLDDGASLNFLSPANQGTTLPWLAKDNTIRVGSKATLTSPVILEFRNSQWDFQPRSQVLDEGKTTATFTDTRPANAAPKAVGGDLSLSSFNVLNYFPTTGADVTGCSFYDDRAGNHITVNDCGASGPRGAADAVNLKRQQDKIVAAINILNASVVSLEEIENSVKFGKDRDSALATLTAALNSAAGSTKWAYVPSPPASALIPTANQDVIRTAFIYQPAQVTPVGTSAVLNDAAFANARQPLAQGFKKVGAPDSSAFAVIVNHFKSKGSGTDDGTGQGLANGDRVAQAKALNTFASSFSAGLKGDGAVFLTGDFNSYTQEDPLQVLYGTGYKELGPTDKYSYSFDSASGSLDHVLGNAAAVAMVTGSDIWNINSGESVAFEYSRYNYNATNFYEANQFRASDHDPVKVGVNSGVRTTPAGVAITKTKLKKGRGTAKLTIAAPGAGKVVVKGSKLRKVKKTTTGAESVTVTLKLKPGQRKRLVHKGKLSVVVRVVFKGTDGTTSSTTERIVLKKKHAKHHHTK